MDIGWGELLIILIVALLVVGPDKLPEYARKTARFVRNFQKVTTGLTGQISKAINLDDEEDGKAAGFKKDLIEVKKSLEKDVADLKATLDAQSKAVSETVEAGTKDAAVSLEQNAKEISETLDIQAKTVSETVAAGVNEATAQLEKSAEEVSAAVAGSPETADAPLDEAPAPAPEPDPVPSPAPANDFE